VALPGRKLSRQIDISRGVRSVDLEVLISGFKVKVSRTVATSRPTQSARGSHTLPDQSS
jgi:hypothetical protein